MVLVAIIGVALVVAAAVGLAIGFVLRKWRW